MRIDRLDSYKKIEELRGSKLLVYITGDRPNAETNIGKDILAAFTNHLDTIKKSDKISLLLYSNGGSTLTAWTLVNLIRSYCDDFEIIVPFKCQSTATLICLGANRIVMTKQATLGPVDPSTNGHLNPEITINGQNIRIPVSVEHVNGYMEMAKNDFNITDQSLLKEIFLKLSDSIHPLSLGEVYKTKAQIKMLAEKLLGYHEIDNKNIQKVVSFLCSESGSHDYTINRNEALELGLNIEKPDDELYGVIKNIYLDIENEMELSNPFNINTLYSINGNSQYNLRRALIESVEGGADVFITSGNITGTIIPDIGQLIVTDNKTFEGWSHEQ